MPAKYYLKNFSSDRSHMIDEATGLYQAQPPTYKCIKCESNLKKTEKILLKIKFFI